MVYKGWNHNFMRKQNKTKETTQKKKNQNCYAPKTMTKVGYNEHNVVIEGKRK
jgi:hypothetical protein